MTCDEAMLKMELCAEILREDQRGMDAARALAVLIEGMTDRTTEDERALLVMIGAALRGRM